MIQSNIGRQFLLYCTLLVFVLVIHVLSCIFIFIGFVNYPNWIINEHIEPNNYIKIYIASVYYLCATIFGIGYGDMIITNTVERIFNLFLLTVGLLLYSWLISTLSRIKDTIEFGYLAPKERNEYQKKKVLLDSIRHAYPEMTNKLYRKISRYLYFKYDREQYNQKYIFDNLPFNLQKLLLFDMYKSEIENFNFFKS